MSKENYRQDNVPTGKKYDPVYDRLRPVYNTYMLQENNWHYIGKCFDGENILRGYDPS